MCNHFLHFQRRGSMGQALRRAARRVTGSNPKTPTKPSSRIQGGKVVRSAPNQSKYPPPVEEVKVENWDPKIDSNAVPGNLDRRDPKYDVMLNELLGRVKVKSGGTSDMGEVSVVREYERPLPKLRNTTVITGTGKVKIATPGTVNVSQLRQILLLHKGEAENQEKPMDAEDIAQKFQLDVVVVQKILRYVSLPSKSNGANDKSN